MALSKEELRPYFVKVSKARSYIVARSGFLGALLIQFKLAIDEDCSTVYFDGERIAFSPKFLDELETDEVSHVLVHQMLHYLLGHFLVKKDNEKTLSLALDVDTEAKIFELNNHCYHGVGGYVIPYKLSGNRSKSPFTLDEIYNELEKDDIAFYKSFDDHSKWDRAKDACKSQIHIKRAIALTPKDNLEMTPAILKSVLNMELDLSDIWKDLSSPLPSVEEIFAGNCKAVPRSADTLLALIYQMVQYAKECKKDLRKINNSILYATGMPLDYVAILFKNYCAIEKGYKDFLMKIPEFYKWINTKGGHFYGII